MAAADDAEQPKPDIGIYDGERPVEANVEHNTDQTIVTVETLDGQAVIAVDVGDIGLADSVQLARDVRDAVEQATSSGGEH